MSRKIPGLVVAAIALAGVAATSTKADAAFIAYICDDLLCTGGNDTIVFDQGAGDNFPGSTQVGQIDSGAVSIGGFTIVSNISQSKPLIGSAGGPQMDITFSAVTSDNLTHTVFLYASDTGFTGSGTLQLTLGGTQTPLGGSNSITGRAWGGSSNATLDLSSLLATVGSSTVSPFALAASGAIAPIVNPYGLTIGVQITRGSAGTTTGDLNLAIPEPASVALLGLGLIGFGLARRRARPGAAA